MSQITGLELKGSRLISSRLSDQPPYINPGTWAVVSSASDNRKFWRRSDDHSVDAGSPGDWEALVDVEK